MSLIAARGKAMLSELGFDNVMECGDGKCAVETALARLPDLAILDVSMPGLDAISAAKEIRNKLKIPILLQTDAYDAATVKRASEGGIAAFLTKPLRMQDLLPTIEIAVHNVEQVNELKETINDLHETIENRKIIEKAKGILMFQSRISQAEAYNVMQKIAMDKLINLRQVADGILKSG
jgi:response regulator NasT